MKIANISENLAILSSMLISKHDRLSARKLQLDHLSGLKFHQRNEPMLKSKYSKWRALLCFLVSRVLRICLCTRVCV